MPMPPEVEVPRDWAGAARDILSRPDATVIVVGGVDVGKSTFLRYLAQESLRAGRQAALVDADIGQKEIGPPACVTMRAVDATRGLADADDLYFVGEVSPMGRFLPIVTGTARMVLVARRRAKADIVAVGTSGLIRAGGPILKSRKADAVDADLVVAIAQGDELRALLSALRPLPLLRLHPSPLARRKTEAERRRRRLAAFARHFQGAREVEVVLPNIVIHGDALTGGKQDRNRLCGLTAADGRGLGLGLVVQFREGRLRLFTAVDPDAVAGIRLGEMRLRLPE